MSKVYVIGATGGVGNQLVKILLSRGVQTTVLVRDPSKAAGLFGDSELLTVIQGDYNDNDTFKQSIVGHERLFILVTDFVNMASIKINYAKLAYAAGVKQIVHLSSGSVSGPWRQSHIATSHYLAESTIFDLPERGSYVALRPTSFFTNHFFGDNQTVKYKNSIFGSADPDTKIPWISPTDIAELAANVLTEPTEKHGDMVYEMTSVKLTGKERAEILSRVLGKEVNYVQIPVEAEYDIWSEKAHMPHVLAYSFADADYSHFNVNRALSIVLHRQPETLDAWLEINKDKF
ncbi:hypothetical protein BC943DRAFT_317598 [Umbelopsis sp. AD052]|nr:hypothetical protein BC943DRAFT_317598 [Umbelopsis sp. AD052]